MILIGVPSSGLIKAQTTLSLFQLASPDTQLVIETGCNVAANRERIANRAVQGYSHVLFVDSDMVFNPDTLNRMVLLDKDIVGLAANHRRLPLESVIKPLNKKEENSKIPEGLFEVKSVGTGVMLIRTEVFSKLPKPWFKFEGDEGEDVRFCRLAREAGYKIWVDSTIPVKHVGDYLY